MLLPEPLCNVLPVAGRGSATWKVTIQPRRSAGPRGDAAPGRAQRDRRGSGARLQAGPAGQELACSVDPICGSASVFIGQIHSGEIFNQYPAGMLARGDAAVAARNRSRAGRARVPRPARQPGRATRERPSPATGSSFATRSSSTWPTRSSRRFKSVTRAISGKRSGDRPQAVRRRRQQLLLAGQGARHHPRPRAGGSTRSPSGSRSTTWCAWRILYAATALAYCSTEC